MTNKILDRERAWQNGSMRVMIPCGYKIFLAGFAKAYQSLWLTAKILLHVLSFTLLMTALSSFNPALSADTADDPLRWLRVKQFMGNFALKGNGSGSLGDSKISISQSAQGKVLFESGIVSGYTSKSLLANIGLNDEFRSPCYDSGGNYIGDSVTSYTRNGPVTFTLQVLDDDPLHHDTHSSGVNLIPLLNSYAISLYFFPQATVKVAACDGSSNEFKQPHEISGQTQAPEPLPLTGYNLSGHAVWSTPVPKPADWDLTWNLAAVEETICDPCEKPNASTIGIENQSLGEVIDLVGTPFRLHYHSDRTAGRIFASSAAVEHANHLGGWTLTVHHAYDPALNTLYPGSGGKRDTVSLGAVKRSATGQFLIASEGGNEVYVFDAKGRHLQTRHALTGVTLYQFGYDANKRLVRVTDADGNITRVERDANGHPKAIVAPFGQRTSLTVDVNGYLATIINPAGHTVTLTTTAKGLLTSFTNPRNKTSLFTYDSDGRLVRDDDAAGGFQMLDRAEVANDFSVARTTATGQNYSYRVTPHPAAGEERLITDASGLKTAISRDANATKTMTLPDGMQSSQSLGADPRFGRSGGFPNSVTLKSPGGLAFAGSATRKAILTDPADRFSLKTLKETSTINGRTATSTFDAVSHTFTDFSPAGRKVLTTIDSAGRVAKEQVVGLYPAIYGYDIRGRLVNITQGPATAPRTVQLNYGSDGFLASIIDPLGRKVSYTRDAAGRVKKQNLPDGRAIGFGYDANGNPTAIKPPGKPIHTFTYSAVDLPTAYTTPLVGTEANQTRYFYNLDRWLTQIKRPDSKIVTLGYDTAGRLKTLQTARGLLTYAYNAITGNLESISAPDNVKLAYSYDGSLLTGEVWSGPIAGRTTYGYDNDFRITSVNINAEEPLAYSYDQDSLLISAGDLTLTRDPANGLLTGSALGQVQEQWTYSLFAELRDYQAAFNSTPLFSVHYTRDALGRITMLTETIEGRKTGRSYEYDLAGRLIKVKKNGTLAAAYTYDSNSNRLSVSRGTITFTGTYDAQDRLTQYGMATYQYNANGDLKSKTVGGKVTTYQYDALGNLMAATLPSGTQITYLVDGRNRRIGKKVNGNLVQGFVYEGQLKPVAELDGTGQIVSRFVYATHENVPDYMIKGGVIYRIITDHLGSPRLVVDVASGAVIQRMDYDEFGRVLRDTNPGFQPFGFAGGLYDRDTKLVRFGARDYEAETGRWTAKDSTLFGGGDTNLYVYVQNEPVNFTDINGQRFRNIDPGAISSLSTLAFSSLGRLLIQKIAEAPDVVDINIQPFTDCSKAGSTGRNPDGSITITLNPDALDKECQCAAWIRRKNATLLAHELTHALQRSVRGEPRNKVDHDFRESIAERVEDIVRGELKSLGVY